MDNLIHPGAVLGSVMGRKEGWPWVSMRSVWNCGYMWMEKRTPPPLLRAQGYFQVSPGMRRRWRGWETFLEKKSSFFRRWLSSVRQKRTEPDWSPPQPLRGSGVGPPKQEAWMPLPASAQPSPSQPSSPAPPPGPRFRLAPNLGPAVPSLKNVSGTSSQHAVRG